MASKAILLSSLLAGVNAVSVNKWDKLNETVDGRLNTLTPFALPCFSSYNGNPHPVNEGACTEIRENYLENARTEMPGAYMNLQSEMCISDPEDQCELDNTVSPAGTPSDGKTCNQGSVPSYSITVKSAADVSAGIKFAKANGVELSVKNSGHDYMTRNSGKGTLNLWTHTLQNQEYFEDFTPEGCDASVGAAITVEAGVTTDSAYRYADEHGATILGPYAPTVPISTGWVMGGGHSVLSPVYGLGADRAAQFHLVTPDGSERVVNACQDPDLFWALRGGGGGTFGVVLSTTHRVEPRMPVAFADIHMPSNATADDALDWVQLLAEESLAWGRAGWGGHVGGSFVTHFNPLPALTADGDAAAKKAFQRTSDFAVARGGTSDIKVFGSFLEAWDALPASALGGNVRFVSSRLLPAAQFATAEGIADILAYMRRAQGLGFDPRSFYTPVTTPFVHRPADHADAAARTSTTPAWYGALWHFETSGAFAWNATYDERLRFLTSLTNVTVQAERLAGSNGGSYLNEANPFTPDWQDAFWGDNYAKLLEVKRKYDPERLFKCWKCVGFEEADMDSTRFQCQGKLQRDLSAVF
ncbi:hypothetical protein F4780DRAFT_769105 [Xylariomycetidae sp. FL0641]|nr:hypothetical protein F4780DRAFT_769105 [Xylariomycetidae sp. FL0641]